MAGSFGSTCRWKALRVGKVALVDARAAGKALAASLDSGNRVTRGGTGSVRGQAEQPCTRLKTPRRGGIARCGARPFPWGKGVVGFAEAGTRRQTRIQLGFCFRKEPERRVVARNTFQCDGRSARRKSRARKSNGLWVLVSWIGCRGWQETSSPISFGEPKGSPGRTRVVRRGDSHLDERWVWPRRMKGCQKSRSRKRQVNANWLRLAARSSIKPAEGVLGQMSLLP